MTLDFQSLFALSADGMFVLDASRTVVEANDAFLSLLARPRGAVVGAPIRDFVHADDLRRHPPQTALVARDGSAITMRVFQRPNGELIEAEVAATALPGGWVLGIVRDVRRRPVMGALRDSEARFRGVAENLNAGLVVTDLENRALYVNERMCELTGYSRAELEGRSLAPLLFAPREQRTDAVRLRRRLRGIREQYEVEHRRKDGSVFLGEVSASPLHDGSGRVVGTVGVVTDATERSHWEREMAMREQRYRMMFEVMPMPAWVYDTESYRFLAVNPAAVAHYGYTEAQFLAMTILDIRPPEDVERVKAQVLARQRGFEGQERGWGYRHCKADGSIIEIELVSHAFDFEGHSARIVLVNDITEQNQLHRREREVEQQLVQAQKLEAVGRLAGGVAHDFNNLLSVVLNATQALADELPHDSPLREEVGDIREAVERGAALTRQLLAFGRKEVRAPRLLDAHEVVTGVERLLSRALGRGMQLDIRRGDGDTRVLVDASQLEQVIVNLAINSRDAMPDGGTLHITTERRTLLGEAASALGIPAGAYVTLEVRDTGVGMDDTTRARAFEPFYTTKGPLEGTGLGLPTVYGIVRQSQGAVTLQSAPGQGTTVTIHLPAAGGPDAGVDAPRREHDLDRARVRHAGRVLLVEDEPQVRMQARRLLERYGHSVLEAKDGAEGLELFQTRPGAIDVIVSDVVMPVLGGVEMVNRARSVSPGVPVVFVSGFTAQDRDLPLDARTAFVAKPYSMASLCEAIETVIAA